METPHQHNVARVLKTLQTIWPQQENKSKNKDIKSNFAFLSLLRWVEIH